MEMKNFVMCPRQEIDKILRNLCEMKEGAIIELQVMSEYIQLVKIAVFKFYGMFKFCKGTLKLYKGTDGKRTPGQPIQWV